MRQRQDDEFASLHLVYLDTLDSFSAKSISIRYEVSSYAPEKISHTIQSL